MSTHGGLTEPQVLSLRGAALRFKVDRQTIWRWRQKGMPSHVVDGQIYVLLSDCAEFYRRGRMVRLNFGASKIRGLKPTPADPVDESNSVTLAAAAERSGYKLGTMANWRQAGMPVYLVDGAHRVKLTDLDWWATEMRRRKIAGNVVGGTHGGATMHAKAAAKKAIGPDWGRLTARFSDLGARMVTQGDKRLLSLFPAPGKGLLVYPTPAGWVAQWTIVAEGKMTPDGHPYPLDVPTARLPIGAIDAALLHERMRARAVIAAVNQERRKQKASTR